MSHAFSELDNIRFLSQARSSIEGAGLQVVGNAQALKPKMACLVNSYEIFT